MEQRTARRLSATARAASLVVAAVGMALLSGCGEGATPTALTAPMPPASADMARAATNGTLIRFEEITIPRDQPGFIDPCWFVNRTIYNLDRRTGSFSAEFTFAYVSRGERTTRTFTIDVPDGATIPPEPVRDLRSFIELENRFDLGDAIIDTGSTIDATIRLIWTVERRQVVLDESHMSTTN